MRIPTNVETEKIHALPYAKLVVWSTKARETRMTAAVAAAKCAVPPTTEPMPIEKSWVATKMTPIGSSTFLGSGQPATNCTRW